MQISRRHALMGAGAAAVVAGVPGAALAMKAANVRAALAGEPLIGLEAELIEARAAGDNVGALYCAAHDKAGDWAFGWPMVDFGTPAMDSMRGWLHHNGFGGANENRVSLDCIKSFNRHTEKLVFLGDEVLARRKAEGRERIRWWIKARRSQEAAQDAVGMPQIHRLLDSNPERADAIEDALWDTPAGTLQGVLIRLQS